jgi:glycerophosphoryl diester phosphodiesterase
MTAVPLRIAHRGMPRRERENTLPSFAAALAAGADGIELDVHATLDGVVVVHHDPTTDDGMPIARTRWRQLRSEASSDSARVPTLQSVCELVDGRAELFVEIKGAGIESEVLEVLRDYAGPAAIHSFDHAMIGRLAARGAPRALGLLFDDAVTDVAVIMAAHGASDAWPHHSFVDANLVSGVHGIGGRVLVWTVNDIHTARRLQTLGVDGICSDDVTLLDARQSATGGG